MVSARNSSRDFRDVAYLAREVAGHEVDVVRQILPGARNARHPGLSAEITFRAHFTRHARHFSSEAIELVHHRVDGVLEFKNFSLYVHGNFSGKVAFRDSRRHLCDVTNLRGEISGRAVERILEVVRCSWSS